MCHTTPEERLRTVVYGLSEVTDRLLPLLAKLRAQRDQTEAKSIERTLRGLRDLAREAHEQLVES
jgi:hypothetical protein